MADRPAAAIAPLERAARAAAGARIDAIAWYLATAEQRTGQPDRARARLENLCGGTGTFHTPACDALHALR